MPSRTVKDIAEISSHPMAAASPIGARRPYSRRKTGNRHLGRKGGKGIRDEDGPLPPFSARGVSRCASPNRSFMTGTASSGANVSCAGQSCHWQNIQSQSWRRQFAPRIEREANVRCWRSRFNPAKLQRLFDEVTMSRTCFIGLLTQQVFAGSARLSLTPVGKLSFTE